eukprot:1142050-Pelagomonas_calceolata.AAC.7
MLRYGTLIYRAIQFPSPGENVDVPLVSMLTVNKRLQGVTRCKGLNQDKNVDILGMHMVNGTYKGYPMGGMKITTKITDRRRSSGPDSLFNSKSVNPQPESGSVANLTVNYCLYASWLCCPQLPRLSAKYEHNG